MLFLWFKFLVYVYLHSEYVRGYLIYVASKE